MSTIFAALKWAKRVDTVKKGLMYGKPSEWLTQLREDTRDSGEYNSGQIDLINAVLGIRTEADELLEILHGALNRGPIDRDRMIDEAGDLEWYLQLLRIYLGVSRDEVIDKNVKKLKIRYPTGFSEQRAINPDKAVEAMAQAA